MLSQLRYLVPALLIAAAVAEQSLPGPTAPPMADDNLSKLAVGEFSNDRHVDAIVLANGKPVCRSSVETYRTYLVANIQGTDIATLHGTGANGRDQLVLVGPDGLSILELNDPPAQQTVPPADPWTITSVRQGSYWASAIAVRVGQVDGQFGDDIVAVAPNRLVIARSDGAGGWMTNDLSYPVGTGNTHTGIELVDWDGETSPQALELAVILAPNANHTARVRIMKHTGMVITTIVSGEEHVIVAPLTMAAANHDCFAAIATDTTTGQQSLAILSKNGFSGPWTFEDTGVYTCAAGDWDDDGNDDFVLSSNTSRFASVYRTLPGGPAGLTLHPSDAPPSHGPALLPIGHPLRPVSVQDGGIATADVDMDGDVDLVSAVQGNYIGNGWDHEDARFSDVDVAYNDDTDEDLWLPWPAPEMSWPPALPQPWLDSSGNLVLSLIHPFLTIDANDAADPANELPPVYEYAVWRTPTIESLAIPEPCVPLTAATIVSSAPMDPSSPTVISLPLGQTEPYFPDRYTLVLRQVQHDANDPSKIVDESPALKLTFYSSLHVVEFGSDSKIKSTTPLLLEIKPDEPGAGSSGGSLPPTGPNQRP
ncbi:MAG: hypothetical protein L6Q99_13920 [Planctomycetes bacterium]|nr:hypothetical protein [Planctomycetota bacterium]